jgi:hypothetical protein
VVESLKVLDPKWPIREADSSQTSRHVRKVPIVDMRADSLSSVGNRGYVSKSYYPTFKVLQVVCHLPTDAQKCSTLTISSCGATPTDHLRRTSLL